MQSHRPKLYGQSQEYPGTSVIASLLQHQPLLTLLPLPATAPAVSSVAPPAHQAAVNFDTISRCRASSGCAYDRPQKQSSVFQINRGTVFALQRPLCDASHMPPLNALVSQIDEWVESFGYS
eukprot:1980593-Rhodomonas_salina.1